MQILQPPEKERSRFGSFFMCFVLALHMAIGVWLIPRLSAAIASNGQPGGTTVSPPTTRQPTKTIPPATGALSTLVPAYWSDTDTQDWNALLQQHPLGTTAIVDPNNGPLTGDDPALAAHITQARTAGIQVIGYVATGHGTRAIKAVEQQIDTWYQHQRLDGIFLDEVQADHAHLAYYQILYQHIKNEMGANVVQRGVVLNPGAIPSTSAYLQVSDLIVVYEGRASQFHLVPTAWMRNVLSSRFAVVLEQVSATQVPSLVQMILTDHVGFAYLIDTVQVYSQLPTYWMTTEVPALQGNSQAMTTLPTASPTTDPLQQGTAAATAAVVPSTMPVPTTAPPIQQTMVVPVSTVTGIPGASTSASPPLVGTWQVTITRSDQQTMQAWITYGADNSVIEVDQNEPQTGLGTWQWAGTNTFKAIIEKSLFDAAGHTNGSKQIQLSATFNATGTSYQGQATETSMDSTGKALQTVQTTQQAQRMTLPNMSN